MHTDVVLHICSVLNYESGHEGALHVIRLSLPYLRSGTTDLASYKI